MGEIRIESLSLRYATRDVAALRGLSLEISDGSFTALVGPSGCGKTTALRLLAGFLKPDAGRILVDGQVLSDPSGVVPPEQRGMGMVFQHYAVWPHMTVFDNVAFGLTARRLKRDEVHRRTVAMLDLVGLTELQRAYSPQLSGGQQQRVALARSLVVEPRVLLLDEPLSNLDAKLRERMRWELKTIQRRTGITFVYVTHDQTEAMAIADRVAVLNDGELQQSGPPREVYAQPANQFVADFMGTVNLVRAEVVRTDASEATLCILSEPSLEDTVHTRQWVNRGQVVTLGIRPEDIVISPNANSGVSARVEQATYLGNLNDYIVAVSGQGPSAPLLLRAQAPANVVLREGDAVWLSLHPGRSMLLA
jgi:iron(III) transport system ATP-binding protein